MTDSSSVFPAPLPWQLVGEGSPDVSRLLSAMFEHRHALLAWYPTVPVPAEHSTPVAALLLVWERWSYASGECPRCGAPALATSFGGLLSIGSVSGSCTACGGVVARPVRGLGVVVRGCMNATEGSGYRIPFKSFPGGWRMSGEPTALVAVLGELGAEGLPEARSEAFGK